jgi:hypothetical protein
MEDVKPIQALFVDSYFVHNFYRKMDDEVTDQPVLSLGINFMGEKEFGFHLVPTPEEMHEVVGRMFMIPGGYFDEQQMWDALNQFVEGAMEVAYDQFNNGTMDPYDEETQRLMYQYLIACEWYDGDLDLLDPLELRDYAISAYQDIHGIQ